MNTDSGERLLRNYKYARKSWEAWCFVNNLDLEPKKPEVRKLADNNEFLSYARFILFKDLHIELCKILHDNENTTKDNIFLLLRNLDNEKSAELLLELEKYNDVINDIVKARNKFYAHLDPNFEIYLKRISVNSIYNIFVIIESSIIALGLKTELMEQLKTIPSRNEFLLPN